VLRTRPRVVRILMRREVENGVIFPENILRTVSVVHIPVDDQDRLYAVSRLGIPSGNGGIIEQAKSHRMIWRGVMSRRARQYKGPASIVAEHGVNRSDCSACSKARDAERLSRDVSIRIERRGAAFAEILRQTDHCVIVHALQIREGSRLRLEL